ncbi:hypothetical protein ACFQ1M_09880 [Sungkyunkwania multivorans]|uniref:Uncharacterized protein n=1 Tax=Sungkyunkwania multivorans TaxID=1173618 RepID=A0ABW3D0B4_9FLAO
MRRKYTNIFGEFIDLGGGNRVSPFQFRRFMNIVYLEGKIEAMATVKERYKNTEYHDRLNMDLFKAQRQLTDLTQNQDPDSLLKEMVNLSHK